MITGHEAHAHTGALGLGTVLSVALPALLALGYVVLAARRRQDPRGWSGWRTASFVAGAALLAVGLLPQLSPYPAGSFTGHMHQHLLIGMYAPLGLVLGAPVTLVLRSVDPRHGRRLGRLLHTPYVRLLAHPVTALLLNVGVLAVLYLTPAYRLTQQHEALHHLVHVHFVAAGYLFAYVIAGPDPAPRRPSVPYRLVVLGVAIAVHATVAQLVYAGFGDVPVPAADRRAGADLMYFGGDIAELVLALAMVSTWRPEPRDRRRAARRRGVLGGRATAATAP